MVIVDPMSAVSKELDFGYMYLVLGCKRFHLVVFYHSPYNHAIYTHIFCKSVVFQDFTVYHLIIFFKSFKILGQSGLMPCPLLQHQWLHHM